jgi:hypothetical protein
MVIGDNIQKHQVIDDNGLAIEGNKVVTHDNIMVEW